MMAGKASLCYLGQVTPLSFCEAGIESVLQSKQLHVYPLVVELTATNPDTGGGTSTTDSQAQLGRVYITSPSLSKVTREKNKKEGPEEDDSKQARLYLSLRNSSATKTWADEDVQVDDEDDVGSLWWTATLWVPEGVFEYEMYVEGQQGTVQDLKVSQGDYYVDSQSFWQEVDEMEAQLLAQEEHKTGKERKPISMWKDSCEKCELLRFGHSEVEWEQLDIKQVWPVHVQFPHGKLISGVQVQFYATASSSSSFSSSSHTSSASSGSSTVPVAVMDLEMTLSRGKRVWSHLVILPHGVYITRYTVTLKTPLPGSGCPHSNFLLPITWTGYDFKFSNDCNPTTMTRTSHKTRLMTHSSTPLVVGDSRNIDVSVGATKVDSNLNAIIEHFNRGIEMHETKPKGMTSSTEPVIEKFHRGIEMQKELNELTHVANETTLDNASSTTTGATTRIARTMRTGKTEAVDGTQAKKKKTKKKVKVDSTNTNTSAEDDVKISKKKKKIVSRSAGSSSVDPSGSSSQGKKSKTHNSNNDSSQSSSSSQFVMYLLPAAVALATIVVLSTFLRQQRDPLTRVSKFFGG